MATIGNKVLTLVDHAKRLDPDGKIAVIAELLAQTNAMLPDMLWKMGNMESGERVTIRTGLPDVFWRLANKGVTPSKSRTAQVDEGTGILEAWSEVAQEIAELGGDVRGTRLSEGRAFLEAMNQEMQSTILFGNSDVDPEEITGLSIRYSDTTAENGQNIISGGGVGADNSSIWLICWGDMTVYGIFPKGTQAGLRHDDYGLETVESTTGIGGDRLRAYRERWQWRAGLVVKDWRYAVRMPNIDISNLVNETSAADLFKLMIRATHRLPNPALGRCAYYMNRSVFQMLDIQGRNDVRTGGQLSYDVVDGRRIPFFRTYPVRLVDSLVETEAVVA